MKQEPIPFRFISEPFFISEIQRTVREETLGPETCLATFENRTFCRYLLCHKGPHSWMPHIPEEDECS